MLCAGKFFAVILSHVELLQYAQCHAIWQSGRHIIVDPHHLRESSQNSSKLLVSESYLCCGGDKAIPILYSDFPSLGAGFSHRGQ